MLASYAIVVRRAAIPTVLGALVMIAVGAALVGVKGLVGALLGVGDRGPVPRHQHRGGRLGGADQPARDDDRRAGHFLVKIIVLAVVVSSLEGTTAFSTRTLGFTAIGCILLWSAAQVIAAMRVRLLYVDPGAKQ